MANSSHSPTPSDMILTQTPPLAALSASAPQAPHISARGLEQPKTPSNLTYSAPSEDGEAEVHLRLPTYFCAPNFAYLMVADAYDAVAGLDGVRRTEVVLDDHFAAMGGWIASTLVRLGDLKFEFRPAVDEEEG